MKKVYYLLIFACLLFSLSVQAQIERDDLYLEGLQYQKNVFEASIYQLGAEYYPRFSIEGYSVYRSGWGLWGLGEYSQPIVYQKWIQKGYDLNKNFGISAKLGLSYDFDSYTFGKVKLFAGAGLDLVKSCFGPLVGVYIDKGNWSLRALGVYSLTTAYKSEYSEEDLEKFGGYGDPVYIRGFDPNSWYKFFLSYSFDKNLKAGIISERFLATGLFAEYDFRIKPRPCLQNVKIRAISGRNFESKQFCSSAGVILEL